MPPKKQPRPFDLGNILQAYIYSDSFLHVSFAKTTEIFCRCLIGLDQCIFFVQCSSTCLEC